MRVTLVLSILLFTTAAHAMGSDLGVELIAWNPDGSAALLRNTSFHDGDRSESFEVVAAGAKSIFVATSSTSRDDSKDAEQIDVATCTTAARALDQALRANKFRGVAVHPERCHDGKRAVVVVATEASAEVAQSWVAIPQGRMANQRELDAWEVVKHMQPTVTLHCDDASSEPAIDVANRGGRLILVISTSRGGSPVKANLFVFARGKTGYTEQPGM